ncbi:hypothetical protein ACWC2T_20260 [Streptomyces sp. NPDC001393]
MVGERGDERVAKVHAPTGGEGTRKVLECVGLKDALVQGFAVVRDGGTISRVGTPQFTDVPFGFADCSHRSRRGGLVVPRLPPSDGRAVCRQR